MQSCMLAYGGLGTCRARAAGYMQGRAAEYMQGRATRHLQGLFVCAV